jgi:hypothetical protein
MIAIHIGHMNLLYIGRGHAVPLDNHMNGGTSHTFMSHRQWAADDDRIIL